MEAFKQENATRPAHEYKLFSPGRGISGTRWIATKRATVVLDDLIDPQGRKNNNFVSIPPNSIVDLYELLSTYHVEIARKAAKLVARAETLEAEKERATFDAETEEERAAIEEKIDNEYSKMELEIKREMDVSIKMSRSLKEYVDRKHIVLLPPDFDPDRHGVEFNEEAPELPTNVGGSVRCPDSEYERRYNKEIMKIKAEADKAKEDPFSPSYSPRT